MSEVAHTLTRLHGRMIVTWPGLSAGDTLAHYEPPTGYTLESVQAEGTFDGESVDVTGSQDETNFRSVLSAAIAAPGVTSPTMQARSYSGEVSDGGGGPDVTVTMFFQANY